MNLGRLVGADRAKPDPVRDAEKRVAICRRSSESLGERKAKADTALDKAEARERAARADHDRALLEDDASATRKAAERLEKVRRELDEARASAIAADAELDASARVVLDAEAELEREQRNARISELQHAASAETFRQRTAPAARELVQLLTALATAGDAFDVAFADSRAASEELRQMAAPVPEATPLDLHHVLRPIVDALIERDPGRAPAMLSAFPTGYYPLSRSPVGEMFRPQPGRTLSPGLEAAIDLLERPHPECPPATADEARARLDAYFALRLATPTVPEKP